MDSITTFLNKYKGQLLILGGILLVIFVLFIDKIRIKEPTLVAPYSLVNKDSDQNNIINELYLESSSPLNGTETKSLDPYKPIIFNFSDPIDPDSVEVTILPYIPYSVLVPEDIPNQVVIIPKDIGWEPLVEYIIQIDSAKGTNGSILLHSVTYRYKNTPPPLDYRTLPY